MLRKRRRAPTHPIEHANRKDDIHFAKDYLQPNPQWTSSWTQPHTSSTYTIRLAGSGILSDAELEACFGLIEETSGADYRASAQGWHPAQKRKEMRSEDLRYILVTDEIGEIRGFTSFMPCFEEGQPVVYCYEIHLKPDLRGTGLGKLLMSFLVTVAENLPPIEKVMLTCFLSNKGGLEFYRKLGFEKDAISPEPRKLRFGKVFTPDYMIMGKAVRRGQDGKVK